MWYQRKPPRHLPNSLKKRLPDFLEPEKFRRRYGSHERYLGLFARCQGPSCTQSYIVTSLDRLHCSRRCKTRTINYWLQHGTLPKPPILIHDLLCYPRPQHAWKAEAEQRRLEAESSPSRQEWLRLHANEEK